MSECIHLVDVPQFLYKGDMFVTSFPKKGSFLKGKNLFPIGIFFFLFVVNSFLKGVKTAYLVLLSIQSPANMSKLIKVKRGKRWFPCNGSY